MGGMGERVVRKESGERNGIAIGGATPVQSGPAGVMGERARALRPGTGSRDRTPTQTGENDLPLRSPDQRLHRLTSPGRDRLGLALVALRVLALIALATRRV